MLRHMVILRNQDVMRVAQYKHHAPGETTAAERGVATHDERHVTPLCKRVSLDTLWVVCRHVGVGDVIGVGRKIDRWSCSIHRAQIMRKGKRHPGAARPGIRTHETIWIPAAEAVGNPPTYPRGGHVPTENGSLNCGYAETPPAADSSKRTHPRLRRRDYRGLIRRLRCVAHSSDRHE